MAMMAGQLTLIGPLSESECQLVKRMVFDGTGAICIERSMLNDKHRRAA